VAEFTSDVQHVPGANNMVADTLSRLRAPPSTAPAPARAIPATSQQLDLPVITAAQRTCPSVEAAKGTSLELQLIKFGDVRVLCDIRLAQPRPFIPLAYHQAVFAALHQLAHPGICAIHHLLAASVIWEGMNRDALAWCQDCQRARVTKQPAAAI
jgi:hypothetical protein